MGLFDEPILIDGKDVSYKRPRNAKLLDLNNFFRPSKMPGAEIKAEDNGCNGYFSH